MAIPKSRLLRWLIAVAAFIVILIAGRSVWLAAMGRYLVSAQPPDHAEMIVVLAGDDGGNRILKAAELVKEGWAPRILVSGPLCCYGHHESDLAIPYVVARGYPPDWFIPLPIQATSTRQEGQLIVAELRRRNVHRFLVVTSDYHTRRAAGVYRRLAPPGSFRIVAAPDRYFSADGWWRSRDGQRQCAIEWMKTVAYWMGL